MLFRERDFRALITRHAGDPGTDIGRLEAIGALNFLDLDDVPVGREGEPIDPRSIISLPMLSGKPVLPAFERSPKDPFLQQIDSSGHKWVIFVDDTSQPYVVLDAHHFLRDVLFDERPVMPERYWHRPLVVTDSNMRLGEVIGQMKVRPENSRRRRRRSRPDPALGTGSAAHHHGRRPARALAARHRHGGEGCGAREGFRVPDRGSGNPTPLGGWDRGEGTPMSTPPNATTTRGPYRSTNQPSTGTSQVSVAMKMLNAT